MPGVTGTNGAQQRTITESGMSGRPLVLLDARIYCVRALITGNRKSARWPRKIDSGNMAVRKNNVDVAQTATETGAVRARACIGNGHSGIGRVLPDFAGRFKRLPGGSAHACDHLFLLHPYHRRPRVLRGLGALARTSCEREAQR